MGKSGPPGGNPAHPNKVSQTPLKPYPRPRISKQQANLTKRVLLDLSDLNGGAEADEPQEPEGAALVSQGGMAGASHLQSTRQ